jgi:hypothetical protein
MRPTLLCLLILASLAPGASAATSIHILGGFNGWDESLWQGPGMTEVEPGLWRDTVDIFPYFVDQGFQEFKFVTDQQWVTPPDYVLCPDRLDDYTRLSGPVCNVDGLNLVMFAETPGQYELTLDENGLEYSAALQESFSSQVTGRIEFGGVQLRLPVATVRLGDAEILLRLAETTSDPIDGSFTLDRLGPGIFDIQVLAPGYQDGGLLDVTVPATGTVDVGTITLEPGCTSMFSQIQVVGDFNGWDESAPSMTLEDSCEWLIVLDVPQGCHYLKFRTDGAWGNDFGTCTSEDPNCQFPASGTACLVGATTGTALGQVEFPTTGRYEFRLNEATGAYEIDLAPVTTDTTSWGALKSRFR